MSKITFVCCPKPFLPEYKIMQTNAILSWKRLKSCDKIIVCGNEEGVSDFCKKNELIHEPNVLVNEFKTPLLDSLFKTGIKHSDKYVCYINSDILLVDNFDETFEAVEKLNLDNVLMVGQRWDFEKCYEIQFEYPVWREKLLNDVLNSGASQSQPCCIDYFLFTSTTYTHIYPFAIGRYHWDRWLMYEAMRQHHITIDASNTIYAIHQVTMLFQYQKPVYRIDGQSVEVKRNMYDFGYHNDTGKSIDNSSHVSKKINNKIEILLR